MVIKRFVNLLVAATFILSVAGCGSENSNTNGNLTLTADAPVNAGVANLTATALLTPAQVGSIVTFTAKQYGTNSSGVVETPVIVTANVSTDKQGSATWFHNFAQSATMDTTLEITVNSGGLADVQRIPISKYVP